jgi:hypothetical protein
MTEHSLGFRASRSSAAKRRLLSGICTVRRCGLARVRRVCINDGYKNMSTPLGGPNGVPLGIDGSYPYETGTRQLHDEETIEARSQPNRATD